MTDTPNRPPLWKAMDRAAYPKPQPPGHNYRAAEIRARAALDEPVGEGPSDKELNILWNCSGIADEHGNHTGNIFEFARAVLARWGHQPAPLVAGAPGPSMEDVGPLIAWLTEQACQAADASQPADAGMLTWAAQVIGERVNEDAPVAGEVAELVAWTIAARFTLSPPPPATALPLPQGEAQQ